MRRLLLFAAVLGVVGGWSATVVSQELPGRGNVITLPPGATVAGFTNDRPLIVGPPAATTVQLPTFNFFTISTTVLVPDRGAAYLGGIGRGGAASRTNGGPGFANRAGGSGVGVGGISINAHVHDFAAMEEALRAEGERSRDAVNVWAARLESAQQSSAGRPTMSVDEARRMRDADATGERR